jgi:prevent-host-death family protein
MIEVNIAEAKTQFSKLLARALRGERVVICRHNKPLVEITPIAPKRRGKRRLGTAKGLVTIHPSFYEPMDEEFLGYFDGTTASPDDPLTWEPKT